MIPEKTTVVIEEKKEKPQSAPTKRRRGSRKTNKNKNTPKEKAIQSGRKRVAQNRSKANSNRKGSSRNTMGFAPEVQELAKAFQLPTQPYVIPRIVPTKVGYNNYSCTFQLPSKSDAPTKVGFEIRPDPRQLLSIIEDVPAQYCEFHCQVPIGDNKNSMISGARYCLDQTITMGEHKLKTSTYNAPAGDATKYYHYSDNDKAFVVGGKYYPGQYVTYDSLVANPGRCVQFAYKNTTAIKFNHDCIISFYLDRITPSGKTALFQSNFACQAGNEYNFNAAFGFQGGEFETIDTIGFMFSYSVNTHVDKMEASMHVDAQDSNSANCDLERKVGTLWRTYSLWELIGPEAVSAKAQFDTCKLWCVTGLNALLVNASAENYKNGMVYAAKVPYNTEVVGEVDSIIKFVRQFKSGPKYTGKVGTGMDWFYTPSRLEDMQFNNTPTGMFSENENPFMIGAYEIQTAANVPPPELYLEFWINLEYISNDPSLTYKMSPCIFGLYEGFIMALVETDPFSENPEHIRKIIDTAKKIASNPAVRTAVSIAWSVGKTVAPFVAAAIL